MSNTERNLQKRKRIPGKSMWGIGWNLPLTATDEETANGYATFAEHEGTISDIQARIHEMRQNCVPQRIIDRTIAIIDSHIDLDKTPND